MFDYVIFSCFGLFCRGSIIQYWQTVWNVHSWMITCQGEIIVTGCTLGLAHSVRSAALRLASVYLNKVHSQRSTWIGGKIPSPSLCCIIISSWTVGTFLFMTINGRCFSVSFFWMFWVVSSLANRLTGSFPNDYLSRWAYCRWTHAQIGSFRE